LIGPLLRHVVLERGSLGEAVCAAVAGELATSSVPETSLRDVLVEVVGQHDLAEVFAADLHAIRSRDQASTGYLPSLLFSKAFQGLAGSRIARALWQDGEALRAQYLHGRISVVCAMDIHPGARLAGGVVIDHGTGIVIGETAVVETGVFMFHGVTLGSTGTASGDRHPKVREDAFLGAGATILGNIEVGRGAVVAAGSVVLKDVPAGKAVAGAPARVIGDAKAVLPRRDVDV
jgi:serine O-acetyltransferase